MGKTVLVVVTSVIACVAAGVLLHRHLTIKRKWKRATRTLHQFGKQSATTVHKLLQLTDTMVAEMRARLASDGGSMLKMLMSDVESLPTGAEEGVFYGVDLRGTKLRFSCVLLGGNHAHLVTHHAQFDGWIIRGELFNFIAKELVKFITKDYESFRVPEGNRKELGFTMSFPIDQDSESSNVYIEWSKGFLIKDTAEKDVAAQINEALEKNGVDMRVSALVNDTVGTLAGERYYDSDAVAVVILGTGTNAAYVEPAIDIPKCQGPLPLSGEVVINIEWGNFNCKHLPITDIDACLDAESSNTGQMMFGKLISGKHLGEIVRMILLNIAEENTLFGDSVPPKLKTPFVLRNFDMAAIHQDTSEDLDMVAEKIREVLGIPVSPPMMRQVVLAACRLVVERSARLAGAGIVAILKKIGRHGTEQRAVVAVDGGLYEHYQLYRECLHDSVREMLGREFAENVIIEHLDNKSGIRAHSS